MPRGVKLNLIGVRFGKLVVIAQRVIEHKNRHNQYALWLCRCDCGKLKRTDTASLKKGDVKSCGCLRAEIKRSHNACERGARARRNLIGQVFGKLTVIAKAQYRENSPQSWWLCRCECGKQTEARYSTLMRGQKKSCGCLLAKKPRVLLPKQDRPSGLIGGTEIPNWFWVGIMKRAKARKHESTISPEFAWSLYQKQRGLCALSGEPIHFAKRDGKGGWIGQTASLDRRDNSKGYEADNIQWLHRDINMMKWKHEQHRFVELCAAVARHQQGVARWEKGDAAQI